MNPSRIIFIDRDGVINVDPIGDYVKHWEDFRFEEGDLVYSWAVHGAVERAK